MPEQKTVLYIILILSVIFNLLLLKENNFSLKRTFGFVLHTWKTKIIQYDNNRSEYNESFSDIIVLKSSISTPNIQSSTTTHKLKSSTSTFNLQSSTSTPHSSSSTFNLQSSTSTSHFLTTTHKILTTLKSNVTQNEKDYSKIIKTLQYNKSLNMFTIKGKPIIWMYWTGAAMPPRIRLSVASMQCINPDFTVKVVDFKTFKSLVDVHRSVEHLRPFALQADYFRGAILKFGGVYADADTIGMSSLSKNLHILTSNDRLEAVFISVKSEGANSSCGFVGPIKAHTKLQNAWVQNLNAVLDSKNYTDVGWSELGIKGLYKTLKSTDYRSYFVAADVQLTLAQMLNHYGRRWQNGRTFGPKGFKLKPTPALFAFGAVEAKATKTMKDVLQSNLTISTMLRISFENCRKKKFIMEKAISLNDTNHLKNDNELHDWVINYEKSLNLG